MSLSLKFLDFVHFGYIFRLILHRTVSTSAHIVKNQPLLPITTRDNRTIMIGHEKHTVLYKVMQSCQEYDPSEHFSHLLHM